ncbi:phospholipid phosphatase 5-like [Varroa jacobsoni]|uniref:Phosphatidic acid phosphatase type 2/haloperoxidase domain-containing protein n=1 Tax=Varroa destructor TaxID=109461 RepID=A0A7M7KR35_VARDE|nr:phospholipid phosphatase 5-like [Varroa destructor]XP_022707606.1 phospholipid phosphatase 5-like [Varroa jacobsoni]
MTSSQRGSNIAPVPLLGSEVFTEILLRVVLIGVAMVLEFVPAFERKIQPEEAWLYKNPRTNSYISVQLLYVLIFVVPSSVVVFVNYVQPKNRSDISAAHLGFTLAIGVTSVITNALKVCVGRPRPDFFYRCFPSGEGDFNRPCTGPVSVVGEGRKSFPSGHSSLAFSSYMFLALYLLAKLQALNSTAHRFRTHRTLLGISPLLLALLIAISRTCDYHHHWQDVTVGAILGCTVGYVCYRQQYPSIFEQDASLPLAEFPVYGPDLAVENNNFDGHGFPSGFSLHKQNAKLI